MLPQCKIALRYFFSTFFYLFQHLTSFSVIKCILQKIVTIQFYSFYFFTYNCEICFIRGPPVLFERKKSNRTEENTLDNNDDYSYRIESKNGTERYYVSFVNTNKELTETEVPQDTFLALQEGSSVSLQRKSQIHCWATANSLPMCFQWLLKLQRVKSQTMFSE